MQNNNVRLSTRINNEDSTETPNGAIDNGTLSPVQLKIEIQKLKKVTINK